MWNKRVLFAVSISLIIVFLHACNLHRHVATGKPNRHLNTNKIIDSVTRQKLVFSYFSSKLSVDLESAKITESFSVSVKIRKDSLIWMDVKKAAISVARVCITKDSIKLLVRFGEGEGYYPRSFGFINDQFGT